MKTRDFNKIKTAEQAQKVKEDYMCGKCDLSERQLGIICEKAKSHKGCCAFKYEPKKEEVEEVKVKVKEKKVKKSFKIPRMFKNKEVK